MSHNEAKSRKTKAHLAVIVSKYPNVNLTIVSPVNLHSCGSSVNFLLAVHLNRNNLLLLFHELAGCTSERCVDFQALYQARGGHKLHLGHLLLKSIPSILVEEDLAIELFLNLTLAPLLLLLLTTRKGSSELLLLGLLLNFRSLHHHKNRT